MGEDERLLGRSWGDERQAVTMGPMRTFIFVWLVLLFLVGCGQVKEAAEGTAVASPTPAQDIAIIPLPTHTPAAAIRPSVMPSPPPTITPSPTATPSPTPAYPVYQGAPLERAQIGVQVHIHREDLAAIIADLQTLGVGWVKVQVSWKLYQPAPDRYDDFLLAELDARLADYQAHLAGESESVLEGKQG